MPRIDPLSLLKCLSVLLSPEGSINSREEVPRFVNLMSKYSKKLVSKCVYLLILKSTDVALIDMFMTSGGWLLIQTWLQEAMANSNWNLVQEVLELLLITPVDSTRLRLNNIPKLVKTLSKREDLGGVKEMATSLVNNWLAIVKNSTPVIQEEKSVVKSPPAVHMVEVHEVTKEVEPEEVSELPTESPVVTNEIETIELPEPPAEESVKMEVEDENTISTSMFYKITIRDGKQVLTKLVNPEETDEKTISEAPEVQEKTLLKENIEEMPEEENQLDKKVESKPKGSSSSKSSSSSSGKSSSSSRRSGSSKSSSSSKDKDKKHSSKHSSKSSSRDKERSKRDKENDKDKHRSNGSLKHSSTSNDKSNNSSSSSRSKDKKDSKESKEKQAEKDKDTLEKLKPVTLDKIGRIPKKTSDEKEKEVIKKPSMSIEPKKKGEDRPKTVKIFNSKMRSTGLEEEVKPPPPRSAVKKPTAVIPPMSLPTKRPSPPKDLPTPPEKKLKLELPERIGAIKLIPPKPKPAFLQESDIFMDALAAASSKKEPKRKKRRLSQTKESEESPTVQQSTTTSPIGIKNYSPANFYQETLNNTNEQEGSKEENTNEITNDTSTKEVTNKDTENEDKQDKTNSEDNNCEVIEPSTRTNSDGLKGALVYFKRKGPKRSIRWKEDKDLVDIRYFELDETERVNVSRPNFTELAKLDMTHEREALLGRKLNTEDMMEASTAWRIPYIVDQPECAVQPGSKSLEKDIQYARSKNTLQALYFNKLSIPDSPGEPVPEIHPVVDPVSIPLEDAECQVIDLRKAVWPEPKGMAPVEPTPINVQPMFQNMPGPFPNFPQMGPQGFPNLQGPRFGPPNMMPNGPPNIMPNINIMGNPNMNMGPPMEMMNQAPMNQGLMNQGPMNNMFGPNGPNMDGFNPMMNENQNYPMPFNQPNMFPPPNTNNNFNMERGNNTHRGRASFRRGHNNNWNRNIPRGGSSWRGGGDHRGGRICKNVKNHGYCRKIDNCPFIHPN